MSERTVEDYRKILANLGVTVTEKQIKRAVKHRDTHDTLSEATKDMSIGFSKLTPLYCLMVVVEDEQRVAPLMEHRANDLLFASETALKEHEKTSGERLFVLFHEENLGCGLVGLDKKFPHVSNVVIQDVGNSACHLLSSAQGKALCGPVIVVKARTPGTTAQQSEKIWQARQTLLRLFDAEPSPKRKPAPSSSSSSSDANASDSVSESESASSSSSSSEEHKTKSKSKKKTKHHKSSKQQKKKKQPPVVVAEKKKKPKKATPPPDVKPKKAAQPLPPPLPVPAKKAVPEVKKTPLPVTPDEKEKAVNEASRIQRRTEELLEWIDSLPNTM